MKKEEFVINAKAFERRSEIYKQLLLGNTVNIKDYAYWLRSHTTKAEDDMKIFLDKIGIRYYSQYIIEPFIADFCYRKLMLVIEVDGPCHFEEYDKKRDAFLKNKNFTVLRFDLDDLYSYPDETEITIRLKLRDLIEKRNNKTLF